ncbi:MAG: RNA polymerase sigma factor [Bacteroidales bacterium]|nr:RNA polymerase sigma factor [Bacteroidales bacterium]MCF8391779.1 RNA polymerase sigma factor [Bacteroidales bacterium]
MGKENLTSLKDEELIYRFKTEGGSVFFDVLYKRYYSKVLDKCYSFVKNRSIAEELAEDIFSKTFEKLATFKQLSSFSSWLYSITYNFCIDYLREYKKLHYPDWSTKNEIPDIIDETDENIERINYENFLVILEMIHPEEKALLMMKYKDNLSMKQIGEALRISEDATKMRLKRARTRVIYLYSEKFLND